MQGVRQIRGMTTSLQPDSEHDEVAKTISAQLSLTNASVLQVTPRPLVSEHGPRQSPTVLRSMLPPLRTMESIAIWKDWRSLTPDGDTRMVLLSRGTCFLNSTRLPRHCFITGHC